MYMEDINKSNVLSCWWHTVEKQNHVNLVQETIKICFIESVQQAFMPFDILLFNIYVNVDR